MPPFTINKNEMNTQENNKLILGNITFEEGKAIVHEIYGILFCNSKDECLELGEELCNTFLAYLVPSVFTGEIVYECNRHLATPQTIEA